MTVLVTFFYESSTITDETMSRVLLSVFIICATDIITTTSLNFQLDDISEFVVQNQSFRDYNNESERTFFPANSECSRYYIEPPDDQAIESAFILWNTDQDTLQVFYDEPMELRYDSHDIKKSTKTMFYENTECENSTLTTTINNHTQQSEIIHASEINNEKLFIVEHGTEELRLTIEQSNSFTSLLLEIPLDSRDPENRDVLELLLMRNAATNNVSIMVMYPPIGRWRIKLSTEKSRKNTDERKNTIEVNRNRMSTMSKSARIVTNGMVMKEEHDMLAELTQETNGLRSKIRTLVVDLAPETALIVPPNTIQPIIFTIKNYLPTVILCTFRGSSSQFRLVTVTPSFGWIRPDEIFKIAIYIQVPNVNDEIVNTVTLHVEHESNFEDVMKSAFVYVQGPNIMVADYTKPKIDYSFNNNCAGKLDPEHCDGSEWSTEITVTDDESGVKNVVSQPGGVQPKTDFIAGTRGSVILQYRSSCCYTTVRITAIDVVGNSHTREIDVTAWDNLTVGEIAAIIIGALFLLLIIILIIILCIYCVKKRKSKDITFTQRYGSRSTPRVERTTF